MDWEVESPSAKYTVKDSVGGNWANLQDSFETFPFSTGGGGAVIINHRGTSGGTCSVKQSTPDVWGLDHRER